MKNIILIAFEITGILSWLVILFFILGIISIKGKSKDEYEDVPHIW